MLPDVSLYRLLFILGTLLGTLDILADVKIIRQLYGGLILGPSARV
jgi:hypothetical protein